VICNWQAIESLATAGSAVFTAFMAGMTWRAIADGRKHHKDEFRPILVLAPADGVDPARRDTVVRPEKSSADGAPAYALSGVVLKNIGRGPALNCCMTIRFQGIEGYGVTRSLSPVQAGAEYESDGRPLHVTVSLDRDFNDTDFEIAPRAGWQIFLEYEDLFAQVFHTVHRSDPRVPWTALESGPIPKGESAESRARRLTQSISPVGPTNPNAL
jgi:hypothetical protein